MCRLVYVVSLTYQNNKTEIMNAIILNGTQVKETKASILFNIVDEVLGGDQVWISKKGIVSQDSEKMVVLSWTLSMQGRSAYGFKNA